jgi:hypothetical protein
MSDEYSFTNTSLSDRLRDKIDRTDRLNDPPESIGEDVIQSDIKEGKPKTTIHQTIPKKVVLSQTTLEYGPYFTRSQDVEQENKELNALFAFNETKEDKFKELRMFAQKKAEEKGAAHAEYLAAKDAYLSAQLLLKSRQEKYADITEKLASAALELTHMQKEEWIAITELKRLESSKEKNADAQKYAHQNILIAVANSTQVDSSIKTLQREALSVGRELDEVIDKISSAKALMTNKYNSLVEAFKNANKAAAAATHSLWLIGDNANKIRYARAPFAEQNKDWGHEIEMVLKCEPEPEPEPEQLQVPGLDRERSYYPYKHNSEYKSSDGIPKVGFHVEPVVGQGRDCYPFTMPDYKIYQEKNPSIVSDEQDKCEHPPSKKQEPKGQKAAQKMVSKSARKKETKKRGLLDQVNDWLSSD